MAASFRAELLKLRKRPAAWVLALVWLSLVVLFGYVLTYAIFANPPEGSTPPGTDPEQFLRSLYPENLLSTVLASFTSTGGGPIALILGSMAMGSEYGWGTTKTALTQRPGRLGFFAGKALVLAVILLVFTLLAFAGGAASSYAVASIEDAPIDWPGLTDVLRAMGAGWLIMAAWGMLGLFLATLFRGTALAVGLGLVYALVLEGIAGSLLATNEDFEPARKVFLNESSTTLVDSFGSLPEGFGVPEPLVEPERAVLTLIVYAAAFTAAAALLIWRRDVT